MPVSDSRVSVNQTVLPANWQEGVGSDSWLRAVRVFSALWNGSERTVVAWPNLSFPGARAIALGATDADSMTRPSRRLNAAMRWAPRTPLAALPRLPGGRRLPAGGGTRLARFPSGSSFPWFAAVLPPTVWRGPIMAGG